MKGGFNKLLRNIVAGASDTEFEKVSIVRQRQRGVEKLHLCFDLNVTS